MRPPLFECVVEAYFDRGGEQFLESVLSRRIVGGMGAHRTEYAKAHRTYLAICIAILLEYNEKPIHEALRRYVMHPKLTRPVGCLPKFLLMQMLTDEGGIYPSIMSIDIDSSKVQSYRELSAPNRARLASATMEILADLGFHLELAGVTIRDTSRVWTDLRNDHVAFRNYYPAAVIRAFTQFVKSPFDRDKKMSTLER